MVVAHPDDETLWGAGIMLRYAERRRWTVICCSVPVLDPIRAEKFADACVVLGAQPVLIPMPETEIVHALSHIDLSGFDCVVTHNAHGEFGHPHHRLVHYAVVVMAPQMPKVFFGARRGGHGRVRLRLNKLEHTAKRDALQRYNHRVEIRGETTTRWRSILAARQKHGYKLNVESYDLE